MKKIHWYLHTGFAGCTHDGEIEVADDATTDEIEEMAKEEALNHITWGWREKPNAAARTAAAKWRGDCLACSNHLWKDTKTGKLFCEVWQKYVSEGEFCDEFV